MKSATNITLNRRSLLAGAASAALLPVVTMPKLAFAQEDVVKIGFMAPLTGPVRGLRSVAALRRSVNTASGRPDR